MKSFSDLFFGPHFDQNLIWEGKKFRIGTLTAANKKQISQGLRDMSPESIRNRFLGSRKQFTEKELQYLTEFDGWNHYAVGIEEREGYHRGVAIIRLVRSSEDFHEAEIAITIIDEYQRMGLGTLLLELIILAAREREINRLSFTFSPQNEAIIKLLAKISGPIPGSSSHSGMQMYLDLRGFSENSIKERLRPHLGSIDTFHSKT